MYTVYKKCMMYMYIRVHVREIHVQGSSFFLGKVTALGVRAVLLCLVCLFDLACFFLSSFSIISHLKTCTIMCFNYYCTIDYACIVYNQSCTLITMDIVKV